MSEKISRRSHPLPRSHPAATRQPPRSHPAATSLPPTGPSPDRPKEWNPVDVVVDVVDMVGILAVPRREMTTGHRCDL